jgi:hypothetical protein
MTLVHSVLQSHPLVNGVYRAQPGQFVLSGAAAQAFISEIENINHGETEGDLRHREDHPEYFDKSRQTTDLGLDIARDAAMESYAATGQIDLATIRKAMMTHAKLIENLPKTVLWDDLSPQLQEASAPVLAKLKLTEPVRVIDPNTGDIFKKFDVMRCATKLIEAFVQCMILEQDKLSVLKAALTKEQGYWKTEYVSKDTLRPELCGRFFYDAVSGLNTYRHRPCPNALDPLKELLMAKEFDLCRHFAAVVKYNDPKVRVPNEDLVELMDREFGIFELSKTDRAQMLESLNRLTPAK